MTAESETIALRPTVIGDDRYADDYEVIWRGLPIGRITTQSGTPLRQPPMVARTGNLFCWLRQPLELSFVGSEAVLAL
jgi:hypothetical protein